MRRRLAPLAVVAALVAFAQIAPAGAAPAHRPGATSSHAICDDTGTPFTAHCLGRVQWSRTAASTTAGPLGMSPARVKTAYGYSTDPAAGAGRTIAVVDAFDDPRIEHDLAIFSKQYGLPACTTHNRCLKIVNQRGGGIRPKANTGWSLEISLDVQWAHAIAPGARILLVEADSNYLSDLFIAEDYARAHANDVSNSWGLNEFDGEQFNDGHFTQKGVGVFVAAGDGGAIPQWPSTSPSVVSVGGTHLDFAGDTLASETAWSQRTAFGISTGGGGGCSAYEPAPAAQLPFSSGLLPTVARRPTCRSTPIPRQACRRITAGSSTGRPDGSSSAERRRRRPLPPRVPRRPASS